jgi:hypothetical protein
LGNVTSAVSPYGGMPTAELNEKLAQQRYLIDRTARVASGIGRWGGGLPPDPWAGEPIPQEPVPKTGTYGRFGPIMPDLRQRQFETLPERTWPPGYAAPYSPASLTTPQLPSTGYVSANAAIPGPITPETAYGGRTALQALMGPQMPSANAATGPVGYGAPSLTSRSFQNLNDLANASVMATGIANPALATAPQMAAAADLAYGYQPGIMAGLINVENRPWDPYATNPGSSAFGLTQMTKAARLAAGVTDPFDVQQQIFGGARYLSSMPGQNLPEQLGAYHVGPAAFANTGMRTPGASAYSRQVLAEMPAAAPAPATAPSWQGAPPPTDIGLTAPNPDVAAALQLMQAPVPSWQGAPPPTGPGLPQTGRNALTSLAGAPSPFAGAPAVEVEAGLNQMSAKRYLDRIAPESAPPFDRIAATPLTDFGTRHPGFQFPASPKAIADRIALESMPPFERMPTSKAITGRIAPEIAQPRPATAIAANYPRTPATPAFASTFPARPEVLPRETIPDVQIAEYPDIARNLYETEYSPALPPMAGALSPKMAQLMNEFSMRHLNPETSPLTDFATRHPDFQYPAQPEAAPSTESGWSWEDVPGVKKLEEEYEKHVAPTVKTVRENFGNPWLRFLAGISGGPRPNPDWGPPDVPILLPPGLVSTGGGKGSKASKRSKEDEEQTAEDMKKIGKHDRKHKRRRRLQPAGLI